MILQGKRVPLPPSPVVHRRFEEHVRATPDAVAVVWSGEQVTYAELDARANRFAHLLTARGHGPGAKVGVCLDYSIDMVVAILGTLKAGAAYVPLDPAYPAARLRLLLGQVPGLALIVASSTTAAMVESGESRSSTSNSWRTTSPPSRRPSPTSTSPGTTSATRCSPRARPAPPS